MKTCVITTINKFQETFVSNFVEGGYSPIIVGDKKTPASSYLDDANLIYVPDECNEFRQLSEAMPFNHYCRKNLGYLHAIKNGSQVLLDTDDDNFPLRDINAWRELNIKRVVGSDIPNILTQFSSSHIWARGYPLELINQDVEIEFSDVGQGDLDNVGVVQSLVNGDPDVDAVFRLSSNNYVQDFKFKDGLGFTFKKGVFSQGNTQSTLWLKPEIFHLLYIPTTVSFRFCDILKMYVAQRCMWEYGYEFAVTSPFFYQTRNAHDYMKDFKSEVSMYESLLTLLKDILPNINLKGDREDIIRVYEVLERNQITKAGELDILKKFISFT